MRRKIYWSLCVTAFFSMLLTTVVFSGAFFRDSQTQMKRQIIGEARYIAAAMEQSGREPLAWLSAVGNQVKTNRVTWIDQDGKVLYDSQVDVGSMENHAGRPEILEAWRIGAGERVRTSDTLAEETYYYAARMMDGTVIRVATTTESSWFSLLTLVPWLAGALILIFGLTMTMAEVQTRSIIEPINNLNPDQPEADELYDELSPLIARLKHQKHTIADQLSMLKERQKEFSAITEHMSEGLLVIDSRAEVVSYNSSALAILGVDRKNLGQSGTNVVNFNRSGTFRRIVDTALKGERAEKTMELGGKYYQILANPVAEYREHMGAVVLILDVTEKQKRDELRREFSANVSHELKTPLTSISGYAEIMKNGLVKPEDMIHFSETIYQEAQRLITLVEDIIKVSRLDEQGEIETIEKEPVDLYVEARDVAARLTGSARMCGVSFTFEGESVEVQGDRRVLGEMIYNICDNAIKYNRPQGNVAMTVFREPGHGVVAVRDTGIGIPEHEQERIFERFYRVDKSHSQQIGGTGLGLSIVKYGAKYHNARIELDSEPGKGTTIRLIIPT